MSKSDRNLSEIDLSAIFDEPRKPKWRGDKEICGFDTETNEGKVFTLSKSTGTGEKTLWDTDKLNPTRTWKFLTTRRLESSINVFYNLSFDAEALLRNVLSENMTEKLAIKNKVKVSKNWQILYIPGKILSFTQGQEVEGESGTYFKRRHNWNYFDAAQFFYGSLEEAANEWLGEGKQDDGLDVEEFENKSYRTENKGDIITYCEADARLVKQLFDKFSNTAEDLDLPAGWPVSTGAFAEQFYRRELDDKIKYPNKSVASMAWDSYHGGRFEVIKRGWVGETETYDINSAYPYHAAELPNPYNLDWYKSTKTRHFRFGDYGFLKVNLTTSKAPIQPFSIKSDELDKLIFPRLINQTITVDQETFIYALDQGLIENYEIINGYTTRPAENPELLLSEVRRLYKRRKEYESEGREKLAHAIKIVINSIYGKTAQITKRITEKEGDYQIKDHEDIFPHEFLPQRVEGKFGTLIKDFQAGRWFNPILASYITAGTRLQLLKFIYDNNLEYKTIMLATDSLMFEKPNKLNIKTDQKLGGWDKESEGKTYIIGAGVYEIFPEGKSQSKIIDKIENKELENYKTKARGFAQYEKDEKSLLADSSKKNGKVDAKLAVQQDRPISSAEALWSARDFSSIADFDHSFRKISANMDDKREWANPVSFTDLTGGSQTSTYRKFIDGELYYPDEGQGEEREYIKSEADKIYDTIKNTGGVYIKPNSGLSFEWEESLSFGKRMALKTDYKSLGLDHWADKFDMNDNELLSTLVDALPESEREGNKRDETKLL